MGLTGDWNNHPLDVGPAAVAIRAISTEPTSRGSSPASDLHPWTETDDILSLIRSITPFSRKAASPPANKGDSSATPRRRQTLAPQARKGQRGAVEMHSRNR
jgi:hypothetical protein